MKARYWLIDEEIQERHDLPADSVGRYLVLDQSNCTYIREYEDDAHGLCEYLNGEYS